VARTLVHEVYESSQSREQQWCTKRPDDRGTCSVLRTNLMSNPTRDYSAPVRKGSIVMSVSVCRFARISQEPNVQLKFVQFSVSLHVARGSGSIILLWQHFDYVLPVLVGGSVAEWLACWTQVLNGLSSNRSRDAIG